MPEPVTLLCLGAKNTHHLRNHMPESIGRNIADPLLSHASSRPGLMTLSYRMPSPITRPVEPSQTLSNRVPQSSRIVSDPITCLSRVEPSPTLSCLMPQSSRTVSKSRSDPLLSHASVEKNRFKVKIRPSPVSCLCRVETSQSQDQTLSYLMP